MHEALYNQFNRRAAPLPLPLWPYGYGWKSGQLIYWLCSCADLLGLEKFATNTRRYLKVCNDLDGEEMTDYGDCNSNLRRKPALAKSNSPIAMTENCVKREGDRKRNSKVVGTKEQKCFPDSKSPRVVLQYNPHTCNTGLRAPSRAILNLYQVLRSITNASPSCRQNPVIYTKVPPPTL